MPVMAPFPYFGGKSTVADVVWSRLGDVDNYVEPFFGSGAVLLARPHAEPWTRIETVNDIDAHLANFWRAVQREPEAVASGMNWPVNEVDLEARHKWLCAMPGKVDFAARMRDDPDLYDVKRAAWWCWGLCQWIGRGWCEGEWWGSGDERNTGAGINLADPENGGKRPHLGPGRGVHKQRPHLGNAGMGVHKQLPHLGDAGRGENERRGVVLAEWMCALRDRLRNVRVACGDWLRVCGSDTTTTKHGVTGVFLDPPYADTAGRAENIYTHDDLGVAHDVREWAIERGKDQMMRICLCGYECEHAMPDDWECVAWSASGGYASQNSRGNENRHKERLWFSPACRSDAPLFCSR